MRVLRGAIFATAVALLLFPPCRAVPARADVDVPPLGGLVRDTVGNVLQDVEILVVGSSPSLTPVAVTRTDVAGRFRVADLPQATYRIAALKDGYLTSIGKVDTQLQRWVDVILHPLPRLAEERPNPLPESATWVYRLPRRYVLEESEARPQRTAYAASGPRLGPLGELMQLHVEQWFALRGSAKLGGEEATPDVNGMETHVRVASTLGTRGSVQLQGYRRSLDGTNDNGPQTARASDDDAALRVAVSYDTSADTRLALSAFYGERDLSFARVPVATTPATSGATSRAQRYWGYDARWSKQLDGASSLSLELDLDGTTLTMPQAPADAGATVPGALSSRTVGATGSYDSVPASDHQLQVRFRAQHLESADPALRPSFGELDGAFHGSSGLSVGLNARDTWSLGGPFSLVYGLGYRHAVASSDDWRVVPQVGGTWSLDALALSFLVSYHGVAEWDVDDPSADLPLERAGTLGWDARVEAPLPAGLRVSGAVHYSPVEFDVAGRGRDALHAPARPLFLTDGNAAVREDRVSLVHEAEETRTFLEVARGSAEGRVSPIAPYAGPLHLLSRRALSYHTGRLGVRINPSGTDLLLEYQRLEQLPLGQNGAGPDSRLRSLGLRLQQDLLHQHSIGNWRLLLALSTASIDTDAWDEPLPSAEAELLHSLNHQVSAGLSVVF